MVEGNKPDVILDEIINEHAHEAKSRMRKVGDFIGADYRDYLDTYKKDPEAYKGLCA